MSQLCCPQPRLPRLLHDLRRNHLGDPDQQAAGRAGNLAGDGGALFNRLGHHEHRLNEAMEGTALAVALQTPLVPADKRIAVSGGWGQFEGENALGFTGAVRLTDTFQLEGGVGLGLSHSTVATRVGGTFAW